MQDIVFALWRALAAFRGECSEKTFVYRITQNRCLTHRWRRRTHGTRLVELNNLEDLPDPATDAEVMRSISRAELLSAVQRLPGLQRDVIVLSLEGLSNGEIADVLGISDSNAGVRLMRARMALRRILTRENSP